MYNNDYIIRNERKEEQREVENLVRESFWNVYRPGCLEHYVLHCLRDDKDFIPQLNFVMEMDGITGEYATPEGYMVDEKEAEKYDEQFPHKEKLKLPGQIF